MKLQRNEDVILEIFGCFGEIVLDHIDFDDCDNYTDREKLLPTLSIVNLFITINNGKLCDTIKTPKTQICKKRLECFFDDLCNCIDEIR